MDLNEGSDIEDNDVDRSEAQMASSKNKTQKITKEWLQESRSAGKQVLVSDWGGEVNPHRDSLCYNDTIEGILFSIPMTDNPNTQLSRKFWTMAYMWMRVNWELKYSKEFGFTFSWFNMEWNHVMLWIQRGILFSTMKSYA